MATTKKTAKKATKKVVAKKAVKKVAATKPKAPAKPRAPRKPKAPVEPVDIIAQEVAAPEGMGDVHFTGHNYFTADELASAVEPTPVAVFPDGSVAYDNGVRDFPAVTDEAPPAPKKGFWARLKQWLVS